MPRPTDLLEYEPLSRYCSLEIGGPARFLLKVYSNQQLIEAVKWAKQHALNWVVIGRGSNTLFDDRGFDGLVIVQRLKDRHFIPSLSKEDRDFFLLDAAWPLPQLAATAMRKGYSGLEFACGIPGTLGGAVFMNAGAHGSCISSVVHRVHFLDTGGHLRSLAKEELEFGYRKSYFQTRPGSIILQVEIALPKDPSGKSRELLFSFAKKRRDTQPQHCRSAGCFFRNPESGSPAGALIEASGCKGMTCSSVAVSDQHANFLLHIKEQDAHLCDQASEKMRELIRIVRKKVEEDHGYHLESEVRFLPYEGKGFQIL